MADNELTKHYIQKDIKEVRKFEDRLEEQCVGIKKELFKLGLVPKDDEVVVSGVTYRMSPFGLLCNEEGDSICELHLYQVRTTPLEDLVKITDEVLLPFVKYRYEMV